MVNNPVERTYLEGYSEVRETLIQNTEPLPAQQPVINVTVERPLPPPYQEQRYEQLPTATARPETVRTPAPRAAHGPPTSKAPNPMAAPACPIPRDRPNTKSSESPIESIHPPGSNNSGGELFEPDKSVPQADLSDFKKLGKVGRQRKYDQLGNDDIEPIRELILFRHQFGKHWPGLSADMQSYYEKMYFSKPKRGEKDYDKHRGCWERGRAWINPPATSEP